jgi:hypothetical protein
MCRDRRSEVSTIVSARTEHSTPHLTVKGDQAEVSLAEALRQRGCTVTKIGQALNKIDLLFTTSSDPTSPIHGVQSKLITISDREQSVAVNGYPNDLIMYICIHIPNASNKWLIALVSNLRTGNQRVINVSLSPKASVKKYIVDTENEAIEKVMMLAGSSLVITRQVLLDSMYKTHRLELLGYMYLRNLLLNEHNLELLPADSHACHHDTTVNGLRIQNKITSVMVTKNRVWTTSCHKKVGIHTNGNQAFVPYDENDWDWFIVVAVKKLEDDNPYQIEPVHVWWIPNSEARKQGMVKHGDHVGLESLKLSIPGERKSRKATGRRLVEGVDDHQFTKCVDEDGMKRFVEVAQAQGQVNGDSSSSDRPVLLIRAVSE